MRLPKERLAELLVERDSIETAPFVPNTTPYPYIPSYPYTPWWEDIRYEITCQN